MTLRSRTAAVAALLTIGFGLGACSSPGTDAEPAPTATPDADAPVATPEPEPAASEAPGPVTTPTCETLVSASLVDTFHDLGWTAVEREFRAGATEIDGGLTCAWSDYSGPGGDHGQLFGWAPIASEDAAAAQSNLLSEGWLREEGSAGVYVTENPELTIATDADGYGMTYLFGDGWVTVADTKSNLLLIELPG